MMNDAPNGYSTGHEELRRKERLAMSREICLHRGENPNGIDRGGNEVWEKYEPLAGACIREAERLFALRGLAQQLVGCGDPGCKDPNCTYGKDEDSYERGFRAGVEVSAAQASADPFVEAMAIENAKWDKGEPRAILDLYFAPWGAAKAARWESLTSDTPFDPEAVLRLIHEKLKAAARPTLGGDKGEAVAFVPLTEGGRPQWAETFGADDGCYIDYPEKWRPLYCAAPQPVTAAYTAKEPIKPGPARWPTKGDRMTFLGKNGYPFQLADAIKVFTTGQTYVVADCEVSSFTHSIKFEGFEGRYNGVMFERTTELPSTDREGT